MKRQNRVAFFNILSTILLRGISIFTAPLFTRLLGTGGYGITQIYNTWVAVIAIVFTFQTQGTLVNATVEYPQEAQKRYQSSVMCMSVLLYMLCSAVVLLFIDPISQALKLNRILIILMLIQAFGTFCVNFLNQKNVYEFKAGQNMVMSLTVTLTTLVLSLLFVLSMPKEINYYGRIAAVAGTYGIIGIPICIAILRKGRTFIDSGFWKFCIVLAIPSVFHNLSDLILGQSDKVMIQQLLNTDLLGIYGAALNFGGIIFTIFVALNNSWCPFFFEDHKNGDTHKVREKATNFLELFTVLSVGFMLLSKEVYQIYVGPEFWDGTILILIFSASYYLNFLCTFPVNYEYYHKKTKIVAIVTITASVINLGLNWVLIHAMGMAGAAVATMLSHCLQLLMHYVYVRYLLKEGEYPFGIRMWWKYAAAFIGAVVFIALTWDRALMRWTLGAVLGLIELRQIKKRKVLI